MVKFERVLKGGLLRPESFAVQNRRRLRTKVCERGVHIPGREVVDGPVMKRTKSSRRPTCSIRRNLDLPLLA